MKNYINQMKTSFDNMSKQDLMLALNTNWKRYSVLEKQCLLKSLVNEIGKDLGITNNISVDYFRIPETDFISSVNAYYDKEENTISFNKSVLENKDALFAYSVLIHELQHAYQHYLLNHWELLINDEKRFVNLGICLDLYRHTVFFCSDEKIGQFLTMPCKQDVVDMFYALNISEREAYQKQYEIRPEKEEQDVLLQGYRSFNKRYNCNLSYKEIDKLIDKSYELLYENEYPTGSYSTRNLLATVMYDLFHVVQYNYDNNYDLNVLKDFSKKQAILARYGYTVYGESPINDLVEEVYKYFQDPSLLKNLTIEEQIANPNLLFHCFILNEDTAKYIKDKPAFIYEIEKDFETYPDEIKLKIIDCFQEYIDIELQDWR